jgi:hypothetical protein
MNPTISQWLERSRSELDDVYKGAKAGAIPRGDTQGTAIVAGSSMARGLATVARLLAWKGKVFDMFAEEGEKGVLVNKVGPFGMKLIVAKVYRDHRHRLRQDIVDGEEDSRRDPGSGTRGLARKGLVGQDADPRFCAKPERLISRIGIVYRDSGSMSPMDSNVSRPAPPANTGSAVLNWLANTALSLLQLERRFDPFFRPAFDAMLRDPIARLVTALINWRRPNEHLRIAEERPRPDEEVHLNSIISSFQTQMRGLWKPGGFERGGNTKTHGVVRGEFIVHDNLPAEFRRGIYARPHIYRAWVRFSGPGPYITPDIEDVGFMSISIKLMGVPGPKLSDEERFTLDMFGVSTPTFVTPDTEANAQLQIESVKNASIFYFLNLHRPHVLDFIMQGLWIKTQSSPFEAPYFSCVPYLLGEGQAMQYSVWPKSKRRTPIPRLPLRPPDDYLRNAMVASLMAGDVEFDIRLQRQTDPHRMPIENNAVLWPEKLSPRVSVATLRLPRQRFDSPAQMEFAKRLSYNPWHTIAEHRPLGNQSRARRRMYLELSTLRHSMNNVPHYEPNGDEVFE